MPHRIQVTDLLARPGHSRHETAGIPLSLDLSGVIVDDEVTVDVQLRSLSDGIVARGRGAVPARLTCKRCLVEWTEDVEAPIEQVYRFHPDDSDDEMSLEQGQWIDLEPAVRDSMALAMPVAPLCREDCRGLCPTCGTDLNVDPCDGHRGESDSPFAALKQLFDT